MACKGGSQRRVIVIDADPLLKAPTPLAAIVEAAFDQCRDWLHWDRRADVNADLDALLQFVRKLPEQIEGDDAPHLTIFGATHPRV